MFPPRVIGPMAVLRRIVLVAEIGLTGADAAGIEGLERAAGKGNAAGRPSEPSIPAVSAISVPPLMVICPCVNCFSAGKREGVSTSQGQSASRYWRCFRPASSDPFEVSSRTVFVAARGLTGIDAAGVEGLERAAGKDDAAGCVGTVDPGRVGLKQASINSRRAGIGAAARENQGAAADLGQAAAVGSGQGRGEGHGLTPRVDADRAGAAGVSAVLSPQPAIAFEHLGAPEPGRI